MASTFSVLEQVSSSSNIFLLFLQEPWIQENGYPPSIPNFNLFTPELPAKCATYIRKNLDLNPVVTNVINNTILEVTITLQQTRVQLINVYSPGRSKHIAEVKNQLSIQPDSFLAGDLNSHNDWWYGEKTPLHSDRIRADTTGTEVAEWLEEQEFTLLNDTSYTHFPRNGQKCSIIDLAFSKGLPGQLICGVSTEAGPSHNSDHAIVQTAWNINPPTAPERRAWKKVNAAAFREEIGKIKADQLEWTTKEQTLRNVDHILDHIQKTIEKTVPLRKNGKYSHPWWTSHLDSLKHQASIAVRAYLKTPLDASLKLAKTKASNKWKQEVRYARRDYLKDKINTQKTSDLWKIIGNPKRNMQIPELQGDDTFAGKVSTLNAAFFPKNDSSLPPIPDTFFPPFKKNLSDTYLEVTQEEINQALSRDPKTAPGIDNISWDVVKAVCEANPQLLAITFSQLLWHGVHPDRWKIAKCVPILKPRKTDLHQPKSYRPISLLPCLSKLIECIVAKRLQRYGKECGGLSEMQMGAVEGRSSTDALLRILTPAQEWLRIKKTTGQNPLRPAILANDIEGAFNCVNHERLITVMTTRKFPRYMCQWTKDFISRRKIRFSFNQETSEDLPYESGVPQGSPLSPILYMILADLILPQSETSTEFNNVYMDDDAMLQGARSEKFIARRLQERIRTKEQRASILGIRFSPEKADLLYLLPTTSKDKPSTTVELYNTPIEPKSAIKILGVYVDQKLTFREHISRARSKGNTVLAMLRKLINNNTITPQSVFKLIKAVFLPSLLWGSEIWWTGARHVLDRLSLVYNKAAQLITGLPQHTDTVTLLREAGLPSLKTLLDNKSLRYGIRVLSANDSNPNKAALQKLLQQNSRYHGIGLERIAYIVKENTQSTQIENTNDIPDELWLPKHNITISGKSKEETAQEHINWIRNHPGALRVYSDGSKKLSVSAAWTIEHNGNTINGSINIGTKADILDGELAAIRGGLKELNRNNTNNTEIHLLVDNQLALRRLTGAAAPNKEFTRECLEEIKVLQQRGCSIKGQWTPSHTGIKGNDTVDLIAKEALDKEDTYNRATITWLQSLPRHLEQQQIGRVKSGPYPPFSQISKRFADALFRTRNSVTTIDPNHFRTPLTCECGQTKTSKHLILHCPRLDQERKDLVDSTPGTTWKEIVECDSYLPLLRFIRTTKRLWK